MAGNLNDTGKDGKLSEPLHGSVILGAWLFDMSATSKCIGPSFTLPAL